MKDTFNIAVISDLHCKHGGNQNLFDLQTFLTTDLDLRPVNRHPIESIKKTIKEEKITADIVVCPGDITDKMDKTGLFLGWKYLQEIKNSLKADSLFATMGNHDTDSRKKHPNPHPFDIIKQLEDQNYPTENNHANLKYWSKSFCIISEKEYCLIIFNSSYTHIDEINASKCIITQEVLDMINHEVSKIVDLDKKFKICLLHHHPLHHSNFDLKFKDGDFVENGDRLLNILSLHNFDIVIHGHKHEPKLQYYNKLPILSSGSFSSMMNIVEIGAQNTFHLITLFLIEKKGTIKTWVYGPTKGWTQEEGTYFPSLCGFGSNERITELALKCSEFFIQSNTSFVTFSNLSIHIPDIKFLIPEEQKQLTSILYQKYDLKVYPSIHNRPEFLIKPHK